MITGKITPRANEIVERGILVSERYTRNKPSWKNMLFDGVYYELEHGINGWKIIKTTPIAGVTSSLGVSPAVVVGDKKKKYGCPHCYKKTQVTYELGEVCDVCNETIGTTYYYQSKARMENGVGIWVRCKELECMEMAKKDYLVKKVVM
jgi:hypothetical protein